MSEISVCGAGPASQEHDLPPDLKVMTRGARAVLERVCLAKYTDLQTDLGEMQGYLRVLISSVSAEASASRDEKARDAAKSNVVEAEWRMDLPPGNGLKSLSDHVRAMATMVILLAETYRVLTEQVKTHDPASQTP